jgi:hypothetical protein
VVQLKGEEMKMEIDDKMNHCFVKLDEYKADCKTSFKTSDYLKEAERIAQVRDSSRKQLNDWLIALDKIKLNEPKWRRIKGECETKIVSIQNELKRYKVEFLLQNR